MTKRRLLIIMLVVPIFLLTTLLGSAQISDSQYQKIDSLFVAWNLPNHPGGAVGIVKNGKTVFSKAYGLASLENLSKLMIRYLHVKKHRNKPKMNHFQ